MKNFKQKSGKYFTENTPQRFKSYYFAIFAFHICIHLSFPLYRHHINLKNKGNICIYIYTYENNTDLKHRFSPHKNDVFF